MSEDLSPFWVEVVRDQHVPVVIVHGEVDLVNGPHLQTRLDSVIDLTGGDLLVDLADVGYIDSSGLATLLATYDRLADAGRHLSVKNPSMQVVRLFEICGVSHLNSVEGFDGDGHRPASTASQHTTS